MSELETPEVDINQKELEENTKKQLEEIKNANEEYRKLDKVLKEKRAEIEKLQFEAYAALQKATTMNEQFNMSVNNQLLQDRNKMKDEIEKLKERLNKNQKK